MKNKLPDVKKVRQLYPIYLHLYIEICGLIFIPFVLYIGWLMILTIVASKPFTEEMNYSSLKDLMFQYSIPFSIFFGIFPMFYVLFFKRLKLKEINVLPNKNKWYIFSVVLLIIMSACVILYVKQKLSTELFLILIIHNFFVAFTEELLARGIILSLLLKSMRPIASIILNGIIFAFVFHSAADSTINLLLRLPLGILLAFLSYWTRSIHPSILLHWMYNVGVEFL